MRTTEVFLAEVGSVGEGVVVPLSSCCLRSLCVACPAPAFPCLNLKSPTSAFSLTQTNKIQLARCLLGAAVRLSSKAEAELLGTAGGVWLGVSHLLFLFWVLIPRVSFVFYAQLFLCLGMVELPAIIGCLWFFISLSNSWKAFLPG